MRQGTIIVSILGSTISNEEPTFNFRDRHATLDDTKFKTIDDRSQKTSPNTGS